MPGSERPSFVAVLRHPLDVPLEGDTSPAVGPADLDHLAEAVVVVLIAFSSMRRTHPAWSADAPIPGSVVSPSRSAGPARVPPAGQGWGFEPFLQHMELGVGRMMSSAARLLVARAQRACSRRGISAPKIPNRASERLAVCRREDPGDGVAPRVPGSGRTLRVARDAPVFVGGRTRCEEEYRAALRRGGVSEFRRPPESNKWTASR